MNLEQDEKRKRGHSEGEGAVLHSSSSADVDSTMKSREDEMRAILTHQLELEIALRKRVAKVVEARIAWAEQLKEAIIRNQGAQLTSDPAKTKHRALESLAAIHAPLNLDPHTTHPRGQLPLVYDHTPTPSTSKQLYLIPPTTEPGPFPPLLLLSCPCPSCPTPHPSGTLQGLLNHARIAHGPIYAYASHDEFLRAPGTSRLLQAVQDPEQYARVVAEGVRVKIGGVRGLRELFESALEGRDGGVGLGLSTESPELAGLLGRKVRKGEIRAVAQDEVVDVEGVDESEVVPGKEKWRKYGVWAPRKGRGDPVEDMVDEGEESVQQLAPDVRPSQAPAPQHSSRFHIKKRVVMSDWSRSLPRTHIQQDGPTHRWMIRLTAPSYSDHITTFLSAIRVQCASIPPLFGDTITCASPPFVVSRLSKEPFLARITLVFADDRTKDITITHWVDLDPMCSGNPVLGAEQIFDVELDRNAQPLPADTSKDYVSSTVLWSEDRGVSDVIAEGGANIAPFALENVETEALVKSEVQKGDILPTEIPTNDTATVEKAETLHERLIPIINKLRARLPLTLEDAKTRGTPRVPYMLFATHSELLDAIHGRRKAVEWYYTRTMLAMLKAEYPAYDADLDPQLVEGLGASRLYAYLVAENAFPRPESPITSIKIEELSSAEQAVPTAQTPMGPTRYCGACGLNVLTHPSTTQRPMCDIALWTMLRPAREHIRQVNLAPGAITTQGVRAPIRGASYLVECASPQMVVAFHALTRSWGLKAFEYSSKRRNPAALADHSRALGSRFPLDALGVDASHVDRTLAPHALLVLVAKVFIRRLIAEVLRARDEMLGELTHAPGPSVLTSTHISRALMDGRNSEGWLPLMTVARPGFVHTGSTQG